MPLPEKQQDLSTTELNELLEELKTEVHWDHVWSNPSDVRDRKDQEFVVAVFQLIFKSDETTDHKLSPQAED